MDITRRDLLKGGLLGTGVLLGGDAVMRLLLAARGGGGFAAPFVPSGPYAPGFAGVTLLTQLHCHTTSSDGSYSPADVVAGYLGAGYDVLAITDHDTVTVQPNGIATKITGNELSPTDQHIVSINSTYTRGATTDPQAIIDGIVGAGGTAHLAHPDWDPGLTYAEMAALTDYLGLEIHSGYTMSIGSDPTTATGYALNQWDQLLTNVRRDVWGLSVDDLHVMTDYMTYDLGRLQVFADSTSVGDVMAAVAAGNFAADVSNHGVTPGYPVRSTQGVTLACAGATRIEAWGSSGLLDTSVGASIDHGWDGSSTYVRLVAVGDYTEPFDAALSDRWIAVDGTWAVAGGVLSLSSDVTTRRLILRRQREGAFTAQVDIRLGSGGTDAAALMFNVLDANRYYMVRIGEAGAGDFNNTLSIAKTTDGTFTNPLAFRAFDPSAATWYTLKLDASAAGVLRAKVWDRTTAEPDWMVSVTDATWGHGAFGLRANRTADYDNLYIDGFRTYYQPIAIN